MSADLAALLRRLRRAGYVVTRTRSSHWKIRDRHGRLVSVTGSTPSDWRALANVRADIRRHQTLRNTP